jgi:hypothetical protein
MEKKIQRRGPNLAQGHDARGLAARPSRPNLAAKAAQLARP